MWPFLAWSWPDIGLDTSTVSNINTINSLPYGLGVFGESFGPKLLFLWSLPEIWYFWSNLKAPNFDILPDLDLTRDLILKN